LTSQTGAAQGPRFDPTTTIHFVALSITISSIIVSLKLLESNFSVVIPGLAVVNWFSGGR